MGRNTPILQEIVDVLFTELDEQAAALNRLETHFHDCLLVDAGNITAVGEYAEQLRLLITEDERSTVLDYIAEQKMAVVTIDIVEAAINERFGWGSVYRTVNGKRGWPCWSFFERMGGITWKLVMNPSKVLLKPLPLVHR